jgi:predicted nucleic acid-binding protein
MKVIVDTSVWSSALRRGGQNNSATVEELRHLVQDHRVQMIGPVRQEILSGIRHDSQFSKLRAHLQNFPDLSILTEDYVTAAKFFNLCRAKGTGIKYRFFDLRCRGPQQVRHLLHG